jgi:DNA-binding response OmpR family regulator
MALVLIIDDEPEICRFVVRALTSAGHQAISATDGTAGLKLATERRPDLVVLDLKMPDVDGRMILAALAAHHVTQRVLILSAHSSVDVRIDCLERGAVDFLAKPFAVRELVARIEARLQEHRDVASPHTLRVGQLVLDLRHRTVSVGDVVTTLSQREFLLLQYMMRNVGMVCSREELLSEVWGFDFDPGSNVVDVYIRRLRSKVEGDLIRTVRNVGYELESA